MTTRIEADIIARDRASRTFNTVGDSAHRSGGLIGKFGTTVAGVFTGAALYNGVSRLASGLADLTEAAADDEAQAKRLAFAYKQNADATNSQIAASEAWISKLGETKGIADDVLRPALTRLVGTTHDIGEAQKDVNLALDVAAGTGKSFNTVIDAMVKGENGVTSGFGRMGVNVKNAAGETKSFHQITKDLADTWGGQAAKNANTASGAYQRMKVRLSEAGEALGYKLLPYAVDWGEWLLDEGIPAGEDFVDMLGDKVVPVLEDAAQYVRENKDEWKEFGESILDTALPALERTADVAGTVAGVLNDLPAPLKTVGVEALVASRFIGGFNTSLMNGRDQFSSYTKGAEAAEKRTAALKSTARAAAGMGGMLLLADSTQRSNEALGILEGAAGGALAGSAAGPWGALIGGTLGGAMGLLAHNTDDAADSMSEAKQPAIDYASSLDEITGAATKATRALILQDLQQGDVLDSASKFGLGARDLVNYLMGNEKAIKRVDNAMSAVDQTFYSTTDQFGITHRVLVGNQDALIKLQGALGTTARNMKTQRAETVLSALATENMTKIQKDLAKQYDLTPREVKTAIKQTGAVNSIADAQKLIDKLEYLRSHPRVDTYITTHINQVRGHDVNSGGVRIGAGYSSSSGSRAEFASGFGDLQSSIFDTPSDELNPLSVDSILSYGDAQKMRAEQARNDLARVTALGLAPAIIKQLQSRGESGLAALHTLATGANSQQIALLNSQNVATSAAYSAMGAAAATAVYGAAGPGNAMGGGSGLLPGKGRAALSREDVRDGMREALAGWGLDVKVKGKDLHIALKQLRRDQGPLGYE